MLLLGKTNVEPFTRWNIAISSPCANILLRVPLAVPSPFAEPTTRANHSHACRNTLAPRWDRTSLSGSFWHRSTLWHHDALPPTPALPSRRACDDNTALRHSVISVLAPVPRHAVVGHCLLLVDKKRIHVAPPSLPTNSRPTQLPFHPELTHSLGSIRARICSPLSHPSKLIVLLVSTACYLAWFFFLKFI